METPTNNARPPSLHLLLNLDESENQKLVRRVQKWNGLVRIFVHPLYEKWANHGGEGYLKREKDVLRHKEIETVFARLLSMPEDKTPPIIVFEENWALGCFRKWLRRLPRSQSQNTPYVINTMESSPDPYWEYPDWNKRIGWNVPEAVLKGIGIQKILIGGIALDVAHTYGGEIILDKTNKSPYVSRCLGIVLSHLSKDKAGEFETELSSLIYPRDARGVYLKLTDATSNREFEYPNSDY